MRSEKGEVRGDRLRASDASQDSSARTAASCRSRGFGSGVPRGSSASEFKAGHFDTVLLKTSVICSKESLILLDFFQPLAAS